MIIEKEETGALTATLSVKLTPEDYTPGVEKALKEQRRQAVLPGFRPGQVPMTIIRKRVGKALLVNEVERLIDENLRAYINSNQLRVLGQPLPREDQENANNWDEPGELCFAYEVGMAPAFDVELDERIGVEYPVVDITDDLVQREIDDLLRRRGRLESVDTSGANDLLLGDMIELNADGSIAEGGIMNRATISLEFLKDQATREALTGKRSGDEVRVDPHKVSDGHEDLARMLGVDHDRVHHLAGDFLFRIAEIKRMVPAAIGQELFDSLYGAGEVTDEATFRERVRSGLDAMFRRDSDGVYKNAVMAALFERASFELPDPFLKRWLLATSEKPLTPEEVEADYDNYARALKRKLIEDRVVEKFGLEAKPEEIEGFALRYVADQFMRYGMPAPEEERLRSMAARMLGDAEQVRRMRDSIVDHKLTVHFKTLLAPKERAMPLDEFMNLATAQRG
jgi:trigger factor